MAILSCRKIRLRFPADSLLLILGNLCKHACSISAFLLPLILYRRDLPQYVVALVINGVPDRHQTHASLRSENRDWSGN